MEASVGKRKQHNLQYRNWIRRRRPIAQQYASFPISVHVAQNSMTNLEEVINKAVEKSVKEAILAAHPVGSFYFSDNDANPAEVFGGGYGNE